MSLKSLKHNMLFPMIHFTPVTHNIDYTTLSHCKTTIIKIIFKEHGSSVTEHSIHPLFIYNVTHNIDYTTPFHHKTAQIK